MNTLPAEQIPEPSCVWHRAQRALGLHRSAAFEAKVESREGLRSEDVADPVVYMLTRPANMTIRDIIILCRRARISGGKA
jgi:NADP-dependent 3-hydroxy acid dehydrogenase YdfG